MNTLVLTITVLLAFALVATGAPAIASAQYLGNAGAGDGTGNLTLEEALELQRERVGGPIVGIHHSGPSVPQPDIGMYIIMGAVFGSVSAVFFIKGRSGRYAAIEKR